MRAIHTESHGLTNEGVIKYQTEKITTKEARKEAQKDGNKKSWWSKCKKNKKRQGCPTEDIEDANATHMLPEPSKKKVPSRPNCKDVISNSTVAEDAVADILDSIQEKKGTIVAWGTPVKQPAPGGQIYVYYSVYNELYVKRRVIPTPKALQLTDLVWAIECHTQMKQKKQLDEFIEQQINHEFFNKIREYKKGESHEEPDQDTPIQDERRRMVTIQTSTQALPELTSSSYHAEMFAVPAVLLLSGFFAYRLSRWWRKRNTRTSFDANSEPLNRAELMV